MYFHVYCMHKYDMYGCDMRDACKFTQKTLMKEIIRCEHDIPDHVTNHKFY